MRILQIITGLNYGGAEKVLYELCSGLQTKGHDVAVVSLSDKTAMVPVFENAGIDVHILNMSKNPVSFYKSLDSVLTLHKKYDFNLIHAHMTHALIFSVILSLISSVKRIVFTPHSVNFGSRLRKVILFLFKPFRNTDILFSKEQYQICFKSNYNIIPNGISVERKKELIPKYEIFTFLCVGRLEQMKNHRGLIPIAETLRKKHKFRILIAGEGPMRGELEQMIKEKGLNDVVILLGFRDDIPHLCKRSHVFLMPSVWEGFPVSILEAGLEKLPVITTDTGSIPSLIDETTGYIGGIEDFHYFMAESIQYDKTVVQKGINLHKRIQDNYSKNEFIKRHIKLYHSILAN